MLEITGISQRCKKNVENFLKSFVRQATVPT